MGCVIFVIIIVLGVLALFATDPQWALMYGFSALTFVWVWGWWFIHIFLSDPNNEYEPPSREDEPVRRKRLGAPDSVAAPAMLGEGRRRSARRAGCERGGRVESLRDPSRTNWWDVLRVHRNANDRAVRANYRRLARQMHPDRGGDNVRMAEVNAAWEAYNREK